MSHFHVILLKKSLKLRNKIFADEALLTDNLWNLARTEVHSDNDYDCDGGGNVDDDVLDDLQQCSADTVVNSRVKVFVQKRAFFSL